MKKLIVPVVIIMAIVGGGCPDGSPVVRFITGMEIELFENGYESSRLDVWFTDGRDDLYGKEGVRGAAFGFISTIEDYGIPLAGIRIECHILSHYDPLGIGWDIWDEYAPIGEKYGYVRPLPNGSWDNDEQVASAYTNGDGECLFLIGLGDPDTGFENANVGYLWPDYDEGVSTFVDVRFVIRKLSSDIVHDCCMMFVRSNYQNFWEPYGGIFGNSFSSLNSGGGSSKSSNKSGADAEMVWGLTGELEFEEVAPTRKFPYQERSADKSGTPDLFLGDPNMGWEYADGIWMKWYDDRGWDYVNGMIATWITNFDDPLDPNSFDPNTLSDAAVTIAMDLSQPCVFLCAFDIMDTNDIARAAVWSHTGIVKSVDSVGQRVSQLPIELFAYQILGNTVYLATNFILPMEFLEQQGEYYDRWGNSYAAIYVPEGGHLEVVKDDFYGDFNFDGKVNQKDYSMFAARWNSDMFEPYDPNIVYDLMYDADYDGRTDISDLPYFVDNWLGMR